MNTHNNKWLMAILIFLTGAVGVESAILYQAHRERMLAGWADAYPWMFAPNYPHRYVPFADMRANMARLLGINQVHRNSPFCGFERVAIPNLDTKDTDRSYIVTANLPNLDKSDINVSLSGQVLSVTASQNGMHRSGWFGHLWRKDEGYGRFQSSIALSEPVDSSRMKATYKHGFLKITVPKEAQDDDSRQVTVL